MAKPKKLTPEIEEKLHRMSDDLLVKTSIYYKNYNYSIDIKRKADEILHSRSITIEKPKFYKEYVNLRILGTYIFGFLGLMHVWYTDYVHAYDGAIFVNILLVVMILSLTLYNIIQSRSR